MTRFGETVRIITNLKEYNGIRMTIEYTVLDCGTGQVRCVGESRHCFLTRDGKPVSLKRNYIEMDKAFREFKKETAKFLQPVQNSEFHIKHFHSPQSLS